MAKDTPEKRIDRPSGLGRASNYTGAPTAAVPTHSHDGQYYSEAEVDNLLAAQTLDEHADVDAGAPNDGDALTWDATAGAWEPVAGATTLDGLTDTDMSTPPDANDVLRWNGTDWAPGPVITGTGTLALGSFTGTLPKTGALPVGTGTAGRVAEWVTDANTLQASTLAKTGAGVLTLSAASAYTLTAPKTGTVPVGTGTDGRVAQWSGDANTLAASTLAKTGAGVLTLSAGGAYTLTVPATGTVALLATANVFTANQRVNALMGINNAPTTGQQTTIKSGATGTIPLVLDTPSSPTVNLAEFRNDGTFRYAFNEDGILTIHTQATDTPAEIVLNSLATNVVPSEVGAIWFGSSEGSGNRAAAIRAYAAADYNDTDWATDLTFWTTPDNSGTPAQRMVIDDQGRVGIGEESPVEQLRVESQGTGRVPLRLETQAGHATNLLEIGINGTAVAFVDSDGDLTIRKTRPEVILDAGTRLGRVASYADGYVYATANLYFTGTWNLDDTGSGGAVWNINETGLMQYRTATAGANPRTLSEVFRVTGGHLLLGTTTDRGQLTVQAGGVGAVALVADADGSSTVNAFEARKGGTLQFAIWNSGGIRTNQTATAGGSTPATVDDQLPIYDTSGTLIGYIPIYSSDLGP